MPNQERKSTGKFANYEYVPDRVDGVHKVNEDRVEIKTSKPTFESHELLGSLIVCEATVTIYPEDINLPDKLEYTQQAHKTIAKPDGKGGFQSLEMNSDSMYETVQTKAIGRALAAAGYLGRKGSSKMNFASQEDIDEATQADTSTATDGTKTPPPSLKVVEDKLEAETAITIPENGTELTPQLWKSWLDAVEIPENTFPTIPTPNQKISIPKLGQIFEAYIEKPVITPEILKAQLETVFKVSNPRLLTDDQADQLIANMEKA